jgi:hypothetical protein
MLAIRCTVGTFAEPCFNLCRELPHHLILMYAILSFSCVCVWGGGGLNLLYRCMILATPFSFSARNRNCHLMCS